MSVSLKLSEDFNGHDLGMYLEAKDCPQDGAKLIRLLEDATRHAVRKTARKTGEHWLNAEKFQNNIIDGVENFLKVKGEVPKYFSTRFYFTSEFEAHELNMKFWEQLPALRSLWLSLLNK